MQSFSRLDTPMPWIDKKKWIHAITNQVNSCKTKRLGHDPMQTQYHLMQRHEDHDANSNNKTVLMLIMHLGPLSMQKTYKDHSKQNHAQTHGKLSIMQRSWTNKTSQSRNFMERKNYYASITTMQKLQKNENRFRVCHTCVSYSRGENTIVYHQGRRYFIYEK